MTLAAFIRRELLGCLHKKGITCKTMGCLDEADSRQIVYITPMTTYHLHFAVSNKSLLSFFFLFFFLSVTGLTVIVVVES